MASTWNVEAAELTELACVPGRVSSWQGHRTQEPVDLHVPLARR